MDNLSPSLNGGTSKPIVSLVDVTKIYVMGHHSGGGLFCRRHGADQRVVVHALRGVTVDF